MPLPTIAFNSGTGSDTLASGAGPGTALTGTGASVTNGSSNIDLSADSPNLSGVATDGSAVIWVATASGRRWSKITAVNNGTKIVTVQDTVWTTGSGKSWAIGGKRATLASSTQLGSDCYEGWTVSFEDDGSLTTTGFAWSPTASATDGKLTLQGNSTSTLRLCNSTANAANFTISSATQVVIKNLKFTCSNATKTQANAIAGNASANILVQNCVIGDSANKLLGAITRSGGSPRFTIYDCELKFLTGGSIGTSGTNITQRLIVSWIHDGASHGVTGGQLRNDVVGCLITDNAGDGINIGAQPADFIVGNTIDGNTGDALDTSSATSLGHVFNNQFTNNLGGGWNSVANSDNLIQLQGFNNFFNTGTARTNISAGIGDVSTDPGYTNANGNDFSVGTVMKEIGFPDSTRFIGANQSATKSYVEMGVAQRRESAAGGLFRTTDMTGGMCRT